MCNTGVSQATKTYWDRAQKSFPSLWLCWKRSGEQQAMTITTSLFPWSRAFQEREQSTIIKGPETQRGSGLSLLPSLYLTAGKSKSHVEASYECAGIAFSVKCYLPGVIAL